MKEYLLPVILQLVGIGVIIAEVILPSGGLLSLLAAGVLGYSLYIVFQEISTSAGIVFVAVDIVTIPILVVVGLKMLAQSPVTLKTKLSSKDGVTSQDSELENYLDKEGKALVDLHPSGTALIEDKRVDVISRGEYIEKDSALVVVEVTANQVIVRKS